MTKDTQVIITSDAIIEQPSLTSLIDRFAKDYQILREERIGLKYPNRKPETVEAKFNKLFAVVFIKDLGAKAHIALCDGENKHIGTFKAGDIFKPATWNRPAKHKRGSVYDKNPLACMNEYGVHYLIG
jgi:hypothetical protein